MHNKNCNHWFELLIVSFIGAFVVATVFVVIFTLTLPPSDLAYGAAPFADPLVLPVMSMGAGLAGLAAFPFSFWLLRKSDLRRSFPVTMLLTLAIMTGVTVAGGSLGAGILGIPSSFMAMVCSMAFCRSRYPLQTEMASSTVVQTNVGDASTADRPNRYADNEADNEH